MTNRLKTLPNQDIAQELTEAIQFLHGKGWCPATSSNFSYRVKPDEFHVSMSGLDKGEFSADDFILVDATGHLKTSQLKQTSPDMKPSAETLLHALIYQRVPDANVVLHTHTVNTTVLSKLNIEVGQVQFSHYEILKGLQGITTHTAEVTVPIFPNNQDMTYLSQRIAYHWDAHPMTHGFILEAHGLYTWGSTVAEAKRHVEVFEYLFDCDVKLKTLHAHEHAH